MPVLAILFLLSPLGSSVCDRTGLSLSVSKLFGSLGWQQPHTNSTNNEDNVESCDNETTGLIHKTEHEENATAKAESTTTSNNEDTNDTRKLFFEGLKIMFMDVAIQGCTTFTLYVALRQDSAVVYQISALQSAPPSYGYGYAMGISMIFKLTGSQMLAMGQNQLFLVFAKICIACVLLMIPAIVAKILEARHTIALQYGSNACTYAKEERCVRFFEQIFGPNGSGG